MGSAVVLSTETGRQPTMLLSLYTPIAGRRQDELVSSGGVPPRQLTQERSQTDRKPIN